MPIQAINLNNAGQGGVLPQIVYIETNDTLATVLTAGYLNHVVAEGLPITSSTMALVATKASVNASQYSTQWLQVTLSGGNWSLAAPSGSVTVTLPTIANHMATYSNTAGNLSEDAATAINGGNLQAGLSGTAGYLASFPATASQGSLRVTAVANTGNTVTTVSNAAMGQASVVSIPDPGAATASFVLNTGTTTMAAGSKLVLAKANGTEAANAVTASGNAGVITTSSLTTAGGASYAITWTNTLITTSSVVLLSIQGGTNTTEQITLKVVPGTGSATLTIYNTTAATALNGTIFIGYAVF